MYLTQEIVMGILEMIKSNMSILFNISNSIATLDMLLSFASFCLEKGMSCQPILIDQNNDDYNPLIYVENGRNSLFSVKRESVSNDAKLTQYETMMILTGINVSGKTFYMKMLAINVILAQIGWNVLARSMVLCPLDHLFLRMNTIDSMLKNESSSYLNK